MHQLGCKFIASIELPNNSGSNKTEIYFSLICTLAVPDLNCFSNKIETQTPFIYFSTICRVSYYLHGPRCSTSVCVPDNEKEKKARGKNSPSFQEHHLKVALIISAHIPLTIILLLYHIQRKGGQILIFLNLVAIAKLQSSYVIGERKNEFWETANSLCHSCDILVDPYNDYLR